LRKLLVLSVLLAFVIAVPAQAQLPFGWGGGAKAPTLYVQSDTTSISNSWKNLLTVNGAGILYRVQFNSSSASKDPSVRLTVDAVVDSCTETSAEEVTRYVVRGGGTMFGAGVGLDGVDPFVPTDSLGTGGTIFTGNGIDLNLPFGQQMKVDAHSEDATAITRVVITYGVYR